MTELDREEFDRAVRSDSSSAYRAYVEAIPEGFFVRDAERRRRQALDRETFSQATERNTIEVAAGLSRCAHGGRLSHGGHEPTQGIA